MLKILVLETTKDPEDCRYCRTCGEARCHDGSFGLYIYYSFKMQQSNHIFGNYVFSYCYYLLKTIATIDLNWILINVDYISTNDGKLQDWILE